VQLAGFIRKTQSLFSKILLTEQLTDFQTLFDTEMDNYWLNHYSFEKTSNKKSKKLGMSAIHILLINTVIPMLFAYGKKKDREIFKDRAFQLLSIIKAESNFITTAFARAGVKIEHAGDSQALIQLEREYCEKKKCIFCRIGHKLLLGSRK
jgi:hypothetical protein